MTTRHRYYTSANKSRIMADYEFDKDVVRESLAWVQGEMNLFNGNMETILKILQTQKAPVSTNPTTANVTHAAGVTNATADVVAAVETLEETVAPTTMNRHLVLANLNRLVAAYSWGMPQNFTAQFANGGAFFPHQTLAAPTAVRNLVFP